MRYSGRSWLWPLLILMVLSASAQAQTDRDSLSLDALMVEALENNPRVRAAEHRWRATQQRPGQAGAWPDPMFMYTRFGASIETRLGPQEQTWALIQRVPFPGKLGLRSDLAEHEAQVAHQRYEAVKRDVLFELATAYYDLYRIDRSLEILTDYENLMRDFTRAAEQRYATGQGIQADVFKAHVELSRVAEKELTLQKLRHGTVARLNALLDRPQDAPLGPVSLIDTTRVDLDEGVLVEYALAGRQELRSAEIQVARSEVGLRLARRTYWPDFSFQASYVDIAPGLSTAPDAGKNAWSVSVGLNLPIWLGARNAAVNEASETITANARALEQVANQVKAEVREGLYELRLAAQTLDLYEQALLTQARNSRASALASYRTGKLDFLSLLDAERTLLNLRLSYVQEQAEYRKHVAELQRTVGGRMPPSGR